ncbi:hypothetical protein O6H91_Y090200 [Diphasiastrum complanatum]|nr:hypothetical protein O6H91_Y090200 [Diphasiastrum complanatum]
MEEDLRSLIERTSVDNEGIRILEKVMHTYADRWDALTIKTLLSDLMILGEEALPSDLRRRLKFIKENLLFRLAKILATERDKIERERQLLVHKEQAFVTTVHSLQEERNNAVQQFQGESDLLAEQSMFVETLLGDFDEMGLAVRTYRKTIKSLQHLFIDKELQAQQLLADKEELVRRAMTNGPMAVFEWFKRDLQAQGQEVRENLEDQKLSRQPLTEAMIDKPVDGMATECANSRIKLSASEIYTFHNNFPSSTSGIDQITSTLQILLLGIWREALSSVNLVINNGVLSIPFAAIFFWTGLIRNLQAQGQTVGGNLEEQQLSRQPSSEAVIHEPVDGMVTKCKNSHIKPSTSQIINYRSQNKFSSPTSGIDQKTSTLQMLLLGIWHEVLYSVNLVIDNGMSSIPFAVVHLWTGLIGCMLDLVFQITALQVVESQFGHIFRFLRRFSHKS